MSLVCSPCTSTPSPAAGCKAARRPSATSWLLLCMRGGWGMRRGRLFVALLRDQRWDVITQEDEDQARALLRVYRYGPTRRRVPEVDAPALEATLSDDARFALRAAQVLRQAGWQGEPFLRIKLVDPTWTRERWEQAQAALAQWQQRQGRARWQPRGLEALGATPDEASKEGDGETVVLGLGGVDASRARSPALSQ